LQFPYRQPEDGAVQACCGIAGAPPGIAPVRDSMAGADADMAGAIAIKPDIPEEFIRQSMSLRGARRHTAAAG